MLVAEKSRLGRAVPEVCPRIQDHISWLVQELNSFGVGLREKLRQSPVWREKEDLLRSVPGVGEQVSLTVLADLPELGTLSRKQIAPLVGVAPLAGTGGPIGDGAPSGAVDHEYVPHCTWERWWPPVATRCSGRSTNVCWRLANPRSQP